MARHGDCFPAVVVGVEPDAGPAQIVIGDRCPPRARQVDRHGFTLVGVATSRHGRYRSAAVGHGAQGYGRHMASPDTLPRTLGELKASGWQSVPVKEEIRRNAIARDPRRRAAVRRRARLRADRHAAARERPARRPRRHLPGRARAGQDPHDPLAHRPARRVDAHRRRQRDQRRPLRSRSRSTPAIWSPSTATTPRSIGSTATTASARSWPPPTPRSPTSSARSTRSRWPRAATCPTS